MLSKASCNDDAADDDNDSDDVCDDDDDDDDAGDDDDAVMTLMQNAFLRENIVFYCAKCTSDTPRLDESAAGWPKCCK